MLTETHVLVSCFLLLSIAGPLWFGWRRVRHTSLRHTMLWLAAAWPAWIVATASPLWTESDLPYRYLALCLTACTIVAVLGARSPGMAAWNFVVAALLAVLLLPVLEQSWASANWQVDSPRAIVLGMVLTVGVVNYLPTRLSLSAIAGAFMFLELAALVSPGLRATDVVIAGRGAVACGFFAVCWLSWWPFRQGENRSPFDREWAAFRDGYGLVWGGRVQEQFNASVKHAGGRERLGWRGLHSEGTLTDERRTELLGILRATLKRFGMGDGAMTHARQLDRI